MDFEIKRTITIEFSDNHLNVDLNNLEDYISEKLNGNDYGTSVVKYF